MIFDNTHREIPDTVTIPNMSSHSVQSQPLMEGLMPINPQIGNDIQIGANVNTHINRCFYCIRPKNILSYFDTLCRKICRERKHGHFFYSVVLSSVYKRTRV